MFTVHTQEMEWGGRKLVLETGKMARQADAAVKVTYGETTVLCTVVGAKEPKEGVDFFPLTVNYQEKYYATGRIPGGFFKREGRPTEKETLICRLIDRPIRPLFPEGYRNETQVVCTVLSHDGENDSDIPSLIGTSAALTLSGIPFLGPIAAAKIGYVDGEYILNPKTEEIKTSQLELVVAGTQEGVLMVESEAHELSEDVMLGAVMFGHRSFQPVLDMIIKLAEKAAKEPRPLPEADPKAEAILKQVLALAEKDVRAAYGIQEKQERRAKLDEARQQVVEKLVADDENVDQGLIKKAFKAMESDIVRQQILDAKPRIDGRDTKKVRQIETEIGVLPRAHGSALFTRGETQALVVATLGTGQDEQLIDAIEGEYKEAFMLHYNFPPYSVGEAGRMGGAGRREIGHGKLAWRAVRPLLPTNEAFPYTMRVVSEITESNGSSSMATVCGASLALMDAGVPLKNPVAGIAMGLIKEGEKFAVLTDILGDEDHLGDMDFKVAGTKDGITALQMDIKITSITEAIMKQALAQAKDGRLHILGEMDKSISQSRDGVNKNAPQITSLKINPEKIREVIGTGGKVIRDICEKSGAKVDIEDDGTIRVAAVDQSASEIAIKMIMDIAAEAEIGKIYDGTVVRVVDFGAFVNFLGARDGLVHISEIADERINKVTDRINEGDKVKVKCLGIDDRDRVSLSMKAVDQETGEDRGTDNGSGNKKAG